MELIDKLKEYIVSIKKDINYFLIKTNNGKFYETYKSENKVGLYNILIDNARKSNTEILNDVSSIYGNKKGNQLHIFTNKLKINDIVLIPSPKNKLILIGKVISDCFYENKGIFKKVEWIKEIKYCELDNKIHKFFYQDHLIILLNNISSYIERLMFSVYDKNDFYHFIFKVKQESNILCKSLYGLYKIILSEKEINDLEMKIKLESPGVIELISNNIEVILIIIKVINLLRIINKNYNQIKNNKHVENEYENKFIKENKLILEEYLLYEVDKLQLELPNLEVNYDEISK